MGALESFHPPVEMKCLLNLSSDCRECVGCFLKGLAPDLDIGPVDFRAVVSNPFLYRCGRDTRFVEQLMV